MPVTVKCPVEIADCYSYERVIMYSFRDLLNNRQSLAPEVILRQRFYLFADGCCLCADGCCISAAGLYCLRQAAHSHLLVTVSKLDVGEEPQ